MITSFVALNVVGILRVTLVVSKLPVIVVFDFRKRLLLLLFRVVVFGFVSRRLAIL